MRIFAILFLSSCIGGGHIGFSSSTSSTGTSSGGAPTTANRGDAYTKFTVLGEKLGVPLEKQAGFTCGPPRGTDGFTTQNHSCVKFLDDRCKERSTVIHHIRSSADLPRGQTCFMDEFNAATYLDRESKLPPLYYLRLTGTDSNDPKVFEITYTFAADDLTPDSKLGKALIAKYGQPTSTNPPIGMTWAIGDVQLRASCRSTEGAIGEFCKLTVEDDALDRQERERQQQADEAARRAGAPPPPAL